MSMEERYHFPSGGLEIDGAAVGDTLVAQRSSDGRVVFLPGAWTGGFVPTLIAAGETFTVPENRQALFAMTIDIEAGGVLAVDGFLIEVD